MGSLTAVGLAPQFYEGFDQGSIGHKLEEFLRGILNFGQNPD